MTGANAAAPIIRLMAKSGENRGRPCQHVRIPAEEFTENGEAIYVCVKCGARDHGPPLTLTDGSR